MANIGVIKTRGHFHPTMQIDRRIKAISSCEPFRPYQDERAPLSLSLAYYLSLALDSLPTDGQQGCRMSFIKMNRWRYWIPRLPGYQNALYKIKGPMSDLVAQAHHSSFLRN